MASSTYLESLFAALAEAQGDMQSAEKNQLAKVGRDGATRMYADLAAVLTALKPLSAVGLAVMQLPLMDLSVSPPRISVATVLGHSSGQWIGVRLDADAPTQAGMNDLQALGNAIAYLRRYGLSAITGLAQQDTDGAGGTGQPERDPRQEPAGQKLRAEIRRDDRKADARQGRSSRECVAERSRTMPELAQVRNRVKELATAAAPHSPLRLRRSRPPRLRLRRCRKRRRYRSLSTRRNERPRSIGWCLRSTPIQASDADVAKRMTAADQMATADLEDVSYSVLEALRARQGRRRRQLFRYWPIPRGRSAVVGGAAVTEIEVLNKVFDLVFKFGALIWIFTLHFRVKDLERNNRSGK